MSAFRNRYCLRKVGEDFEPSVDYAFKCDTAQNKGCKSGFLLNSLQFAQDTGYIDTQCWNKLENKDRCPSEKEVSGCKKYKVSGYCVLEGADKIKKEVFKNGPVLGFMTPYREFLVYESGIFRTQGREAIQGFTVVKVVGWGREEESGEDYWLIDPMWGGEFGEGGLARVERGKGELFIDKWGVTFYPN